jgi:glycosyltransferase involved in cell wall biosynthesis
MLSGSANNYSLEVAEISPQLAGLAVWPRPTTVGGQPLRLLMVTPRFFPLSGGVESHVYEVSRRLAALGAQVTVLTTDREANLPEEETLEGVRILRVRAWPARRDYYFAPGLLRHIRSGEWDIVHLQSYHTLVAPIALWGAFWARLPYVVTFHGGGHSQRLRQQMRRQQRALLRPLLTRADRLVAVAPFEIDLYGAELRLPTDRFVLVPNGSDLPPVAGPAPSAPAGTLIASVGRLERYKGHQHIIAAMPAILEQVPDARLWIAGEGSYEAELRKLALLLGVADRVEFRSVPPSERSRLASELSQAALVVLLSEYETHSIAALEALALGKPLLVADAIGLGDLARKGWARAVPPNSPPDVVASAVIDQLRQPQVAAEIDLPTWDQCAAGLLDVYEGVLKVRACVS